MSSTSHLFQKNLFAEVFTDAHSKELVRSPKRVKMPPSGIVVFQSQHAPGFSGDMKDEYSKFHLIISGRAEWETPETKSVVGPDTLIHIPAQMSHRQRDFPGNPVTVYVIHYRNDLLSKEIQDQLTKQGMLQLDLQSALINQARLGRSIFQEMLFEQASQQEGWEMILISRLMDLCVYTLRTTQRKGGETLVLDLNSESAIRVAHYALQLKTRFYQKQSLEEAARGVGLSRRHFTEVFRRVTGQTWLKYNIELRLSYSLKLLMETEKSVTAVAFEAGFDDLSHFHHSFKNAFGSSPSTYRTKQRLKNR
ncbi:MAG: helix-turn-helix transcriptional regulator [Verrucomicrobiota bacterium]